MILLAAGGIASVIIGDGVVYVEPANQITQANGLTLVVQESNIGPCLEVRTGEGMSGGCGADFNEPISISTGGIGDATFASAWAPPGPAEIEMTFPGGEIVKVVAFQVMEGYDVAFFVAPLPPSPGREPSLPLQVVAYDAQGNTLATVSTTEDADPHLHDTPAPDDSLERP